MRSLLPVVWFLSLGGSGLFWMFAVTLFDDRPFRADRWIPPLVVNEQQIDDALTIFEQALISVHSPAV